MFLRQDGQDTTPPGAGPLLRLQRRWLKNTWEGARALGLDSGAVLRLMQGVAEVEASPVPVLEEDEATARIVADELRETVNIDARPVPLQDVAARLPAFANAPLAVTTPYYASRVSALLPRLPIITATLSLDLLHSLMERAAADPILVTVPSQWIARRVEAALRHRSPDLTRARVVVADESADLQRLRLEAATVFVWPGCDHVLKTFPDDECVTPVRLLSEATVDRARTAVLEAALRRVNVSTSSDVAARAAPVVLDH